MEDSLFNRRQVLTGSVIAALGALWLPEKAGAAALTPPPGTEGATLVVDVALLGNTWTENIQSALDPKGGDLRGASFFVEGNLYPGGTIPAGDGWDPASVAPTGHWFCRGWFITNPGRPAPVVISTQEYLFGRISDALPSPPDQLVSSGLEAGVTTTRSLIGGSGRYRGVVGDVVQQLIGTNKTMFNGAGIPGPGGSPAFNNRFYITL
jgi:hypothetical protein